jgi:hypothetical protein
MRRRNLRSAMIGSKVTILLLLDFSKAFECVNHRLFLYRFMTAYDFGTIAMDLIVSFLSARSMVVDEDGYKSSSRTVPFCVP